MQTRPAWVTSMGFIVRINKDFIHLYTSSLTNQFDPDLSFSIARCGMASLPFFAGVISSILYDNMLYCFLFVLAGGIISLYKCFRPDGILLIIPKYLFYIFTLITRKLGFFVAPIIISICKHNIMCVVSFFSAFIVLWIIYLLLNKLYSKHSMSYYGFPQHLSLNLWDLKVLRLTYSASRYSFGFKDFIYQYLFELTHEDDLNEECSKPFESDDKPATDNEPEPSPTPPPQSSSRTTTGHHKFAYPETSKDRLAKTYNHRILQEINNLTSDNVFPSDLTSRLLLYFSGMELIQDAVGKLDLVESMARNLTITLNQDYNYSPQYIKESLNAAFEIFYEKKILIDSFLDAEFLIDPSEIYKDERYIVRYAEHIMFVIFAMPYNKDVSDALIDSYHNISELQNDYVESKTTIQHNPQVQSTSSFHQTSPQPPQPNTPPPQQAQFKPLKSDKTFWSMLVIFGVLPFIFVLCLIWYFSSSYNSPADSSKPLAATSSVSDTNATIQSSKYIPKIEPNNGQILSGMETQGSAITVKASATEGCVVKLKTTRNETVLSFYVRAGCSATVDVPAQVMYVYFASGKTWYGSQYLFGPDTSYSMDEKICHFEKFTYEYTLYEVYDGNFSEKPISADEFN